MEREKVGRPPKYESVEEIEELIQAYFADCASHPMLDENGNVYTDKHGDPIMTPPKPLTVTGLALALGFNCRQSLLNYQGKKKFFDTITRAKAIVEQYAETRLFDKDGANGAKFSLANNFEGWKEKQAIEADVKNDITINVELTEDDE